MKSFDESYSDFSWLEAEAKAESVGTGNESKKAEDSAAASLPMLYRG